MPLLGALVFYRKPGSMEMGKHFIDVIPWKDQKQGAFAIDATMLQQPVAVVLSGGCVFAHTHTQMGR